MDSLVELSDAFSVWIQELLDLFKLFLFQRRIDFLQEQASSHEVLMTLEQVVERMFSIRNSGLHSGKSCFLISLRRFFSFRSSRHFSHV